MNNRDRSTNRETLHPITSFWLRIGIIVVWGFLAIFLFFALVFPPDLTPTQPAIYHRLRQLAPNPPVSSQYTPVAIMRNGEFRGCGTLLETPRGQRIVTARHLFLRETLHADMYQYEILSETPTVQHPITSASPLTNLDIMICQPGPEIPIMSVTGLLAGTSRGQVAPIDPIVQVRSISTAAEMSVVAMALGEPYLFIDRRTLPGESGTGILSPDGALLVLLSECYFDPEEQRVLVAAGIKSETLTVAIPTKYSVEKEIR